MADDVVVLQAAKADAAKKYAAASLQGQEVLRTQNDTALRTFRAALAGAKRGKNRAVVCVYGDSKSEGLNNDAGATYLDNWPRYLVSSLRSRWQPAGVTGGDGYIPVQYATSAPVGQAFALAGTVTTDYTVDQFNGMGNRNVTLKTTTASATITRTCTSFDLHYFNATAGTKIDVTIDGGAVQTITTTSTGGSLKWNSGALSAASHTIVVKKNSASPADAQVQGAFFYNGDETAGVALADSSRSGQSTTLALTRLANTVSAINLTSPDLVIVKLGTNDYPGLTASALQANLTQIMSTHASSFKARLTKIPSYLLVVPEGRTDATLLSPIADYATAIYAVAAQMADPCAVLDLSRRMPPSSVSSPLGLWGADGLHESSRGYQYVADAVERVVVG